MRCFVFGTGDYYNRYKKWLVNEDIIGIIDNDNSKHGKVIDGHIVISPEDIFEFEYDFVIILSFCYKEMKNQLVSLGVASSKILHFYSLRKLVDWRKNPKKLLFYGCEKSITEDNNNKEILLLSPELNNGGPALALFYLSEVIKEQGFKVTVASMIDGELKERYIKEKVPVIIDNNLQLATMNEVEWINEYKLIICNTLNFHVFLSDRKLDIPCVWWLHETSFFYDGVDESIVSSLLFENLKVYSVGEIPRKAFLKHFPPIDVEELLYCVKEESNNLSLDIDEKKEISEKFKICIIGFLEYIKGHDVLFNALRLLNLIDRNKISLFVVGQDNTLYGKKLKEDYSDIQNVIYTGIVSRKEVHEILDEIDVLVCPSRQDSMPTVVVEAMLHNKASIVSDAVGTKKYIENYNNGFIFKSESEKELAKILEWCLNNPRSVKRIGENARKRYEDIFSEKAFKSNVLRMLQGVEI